MLTIDLNEGLMGVTRGRQWNLDDYIYIYHTVSLHRTTLIIQMVRTQIRGLRFLMVEVEHLIIVLFCYTIILLKFLKIPEAKVVPSFSIDISGMLNKKDFNFV